MTKIEIEYTGKNWHQGDVQGFEVTGIPECWMPVAKTFFAKSERSGHAHALCGDYELFTNDASPGTFIIKVGTDGATLNHTGYNNLTPKYWDKNQIMPIADHQPTTLKQGIYLVGIQRRKKQFSRLWDVVKD